MQIKSSKETSHSPKNPRKSIRSLSQKKLLWIILPIVFFSIFFAAGLFLELTSAFLGVSGHSIGYYMTLTVENALKILIKDDMLMYVDNDLDTLYLDIPFESLHQMELKRDEALEHGILLSSDDDYVDATIRFEQEDPIKIDMRLKGDWTDHLKGDKWSYRIHIDQDDGNIYGMRRFSLQAPETREYHYEWALHEAFQKEGILSTRYNFVNVVINGKHLGIYALEESFSTELIESQNRREGILLRFDEDMVWENENNNRKNGVGGDYNTRLTFFIANQETADISLFREGRVLDNPVLEEQAEKAVSLLKNYQAGLVKAEDVFDLEIWGKYLALVDLFHGEHGAIWHNMRFYYNPVTGLLEPVGFDHNASHVEALPLLDTERFPLFGNAALREIYARELERFTNDDYLTELQAELEEDISIYSLALKREYGLVFSEKEPLWDYLSDQSGYLRSGLQPITPMYGHYRIDELEPGNRTMEIHLSNAMILPLELKEVRINGEELPQIEAMADKSPGQGNYTKLSFYQGSGVIQPDVFTIPIDNIEIPQDEDLIVTVVVGVAGLSHGEDYTIELLPQWNTLNASALQGLPVQDLESALAQHPFLSKDEEQKVLYTESGRWNVSGDLIVPSGYTLEVSANTTLLFEPEAILYSYGAPIHFHGNQEVPVLLDAQDETWGGIVVLKADKSSNWDWAMIRNTASINRDAWMITGGITFYQSPIMLDHVSINTALAEDAINLIDTEFTFKNVRIWGTPSDGFDSDFSVGNLVDCEFTDIGGDAVDFSGSSVDIRDIVIIGAQDKGISAGEQSHLTIEGFLIQDVQIGTASKDLSSVSLIEGEIINASTSSLATYIKKPQYGPANLSVQGTMIENSGAVICQENSSILIDDQPVECKELSSAQLEMLGLVNE